MQALEIINPGENAVLKMTQRPTPTPTRGEVLVKVLASGINRPDLIQKQGRYNPPAGVTDIAGLEIAGEIVAIGDDDATPNVTDNGDTQTQTQEQTTTWRVGDRVCALVAGGGYAEYCIVPVGQCLPVPQGLDMVQAAALPETAFTVWFNLYHHARLRPLERILIHGGASGIGTMAVQMARHYFKSSAIYVTAGSDEKCQFCETLGADLAVNYKTQDFVSQINTATEKAGVDVILDMVGGDYVPRNLSILAQGGRHVSIAVQRGAKAEIDLFQIMRKNQVLTGSTLRPQPLEVKSQIAQELKTHIWPLISSGQVKPVIDRVFPASQGEEAQLYMNSGVHQGKIVLSWEKA